MRRAKGWFNPKTGEVTVVLPNHTSFEDLQATILHEVVAHKGLRGLLGEQFTPTMQRVFYSMSGTKQADYLARYGDKVTAAEEYMSEMAETSQDPTFLEKVIAIIRDAFRALGIELHLSDSDMRFMLWRSKNRLKSNPTAMEVIKDMAESEAVKTRIDEQFPVNLAPNGKPSNLTPFQYKQVRTPEFKNWFGDWENDQENASKVVDENGEPLVVYHGTGYKFNEFTADNKSNPRSGDLDGHWFTNSRENAKLFTFTRPYSNEQNLAPTIVEAYLKIEKPTIIERKYLNDNLTHAQVDENIKKTCCKIQE